MRILKRYFITGLLIWLPLVATVWVLAALVNALDALVPRFLSPEALFGVTIPGFEIVLVLVVVWCTGLFVANFIGRAVVARWEALLGHIPLVRTIYNLVKQIGDTVFAPNGEAFRQAVLVQYPRQGVWTIGFVTGAPCTEVAELLRGEHLSIYVPTTPNPTSGFFLMLPRDEVHVLDMSVETALKYVVSLGVVMPDGTVPSTSIP